MSDYQNDFEDGFEEENFSDLLQDEFDPKLFYEALSNALVQLENFNLEAA